MGDVIMGVVYYGAKVYYGRVYYGEMFIMGNMQYINFRAPWGVRGYPDGVNH